MAKTMAVVNGRLVLTNTTHIKMTAITRENAVTAREFQHRTMLNSDKTPLRARRNGATQVWKTRPDEFRIPVKYGLRTCFYITHENAHEWYIPE